jgi:Cdc6-like AAA superfamily ATPase
MKFSLYQAARTVSSLLPLSQGIPLEAIGHTPHKRIRRPQGEHWAIVAKTGDGKTVCVKHLLEAYRQKYPFLQTYILDSKDLGDFTAKDGVVTRSLVPPPPLMQPGQRQVWQPIEKDNLLYYDEFFTQILYNNKPALVVIDESKNLKNGARYPKGYELLLSQGRMAGIFCFTNYQEIANGLRQGLSQAKHVIGFSVLNPYDESYLKQALKMRAGVSLERPRYSLWYVNRDTMATPKLYPGYKDLIAELFPQKRRRTT